MMRADRSLAVIALAAAALVMGSIGAGAQERRSPTPDLGMLLNLDLFRPRSQDAGNDAPGAVLNDSMLDQIRALKAMGYLRGNPRAAGASTVSGARTTTPGSPADDSEGQP